MAENQPSPEQILQAIEATGFLMEQRVATQLEALGFHVWTGYPFEDPEESKSREIDVRGYLQPYHDVQAKLSVNVELICECKNADNPFVFITRRKGEHDNDRFSPCQFLLPFNTYETREGNITYERSGLRHFNLHKCHYFYADNSKAVQFCKMARKGKDWEANQGGIYDAIFYPLAKAVVATRKEDERLRNPRDPSDWKNVTLIFAIVVLHGKIYQIDSMSEPLEAREVSHVSFIRELSSKAVSGQFLLDFTTEEGIPNFIKNKIFPFVDCVVDELKLAGDKLGKRM